MTGTPEEVLEDYLGLCYGWKLPSDGGSAEDGTRPLNPEDEEFAEANRELRQAVAKGDALKLVLEAKVNGHEPISEVSTGGLVMRTFVSRKPLCSSSANPEKENTHEASSPLVGVSFRTEVRPCFVKNSDGVDSSEVACGQWTPNASGWPSSLFFEVRHLHRHAGVVWPSALKLVAVLLQDPSLVAPLLRPGARVLELGAGAGIVGLVLALLGCKDVTLTDHPSCGDFSLTSIRAHLPPEVAGVVRHVSLDWAQPLPPVIAEACPWDVIICSDLLYFSASRRPLCDTLLSLCGRNGSHILFAYEPRCKCEEAGFFNSAADVGFSFEELQPACLAAEDAEDWRLLRMTLRIAAGTGDVSLPNMPPA